MTTRQLVIGDDGSASADTLWEWVTAHPWPGWTVSVVTAVEPEDWAVLPPEHVALHRWDPPHPRRLPDEAGAVVEHLRGEGDPRAVLDSCGGAALMAIGPRGSGLLKQLHLGSTAEWLLQSPRPPLAVVRSAQRTRTVLLCSDGSDDAQEAAACLAALPWIGTCRVLVLAVRDGRVDADAAARDAMATLAVAGVRAEVLTPRAERGFAGSRADVRGTIFDAVAEHRADLVALGTGGSGGLRRTLLGSTASAVAHHAPCTALVATAQHRRHAEPSARRRPESILDHTPTEP